MNSCNNDNDKFSPSQAASIHFPLSHSLFYSPRCFIPGTLAKLMESLRRPLCLSHHYNYHHHHHGRCRLPPRLNTYPGERLYTREKNSLKLLSLLPTNQNLAAGLVTTATMAAATTITTNYNQYHPFQIIVALRVVNIIIIIIVLYYCYYYYYYYSQRCRSCDISGEKLSLYNGSRGRERKSRQSNSPDIGFKSRLCVEENYEFCSNDIRIAQTRIQFSTLLLCPMDSNLIPQPSKPTNTITTLPLSPFYNFHSSMLLLYRNEYDYIDSHVYISERSPIQVPKLCAYPGQTIIFQHSKPGVTCHLA